MWEHFSVARRTSLLLGVIALSLLAIAVAATGHSQDSWLAPLGMVLVLVLPGYALSAALLPSLVGTARLLCSLGLSLVVSVLGGLALNTTPWGLRPLPWALWLGGLSLVSAVVALRRVTEEKGTGEGTSPELWRPRLTPASVIGFAAAAMVVGLAVSLAFQSTSVGAPTFTQLWAIPTHGNNQYSLEIGVRNLEDAPVTYQVVVAEGGETLAAWDSITLKPGEDWTDRVGPMAAAPTVPLEVQLYRSSSPGTLYRSVLIWPAAFATP